MTIWVWWYKFVVKDKRRGVEKSKNGKGGVEHQEAAGRVHRWPINPSLLVQLPRVLSTASPASLPFVITSLQILQLHQGFTLIKIAFIPEWVFLTVLTYCNTLEYPINLSYILRIKSHWFLVHYVYLFTTHGFTKTKKLQCFYHSLLFLTFLLLKPTLFVIIVQLYVTFQRVIVTQISKTVQMWQKTRFVSIVSGTIVYYSSNQIT